MGISGVRFCQNHSHVSISLFDIFEIWTTARLPFFQYVNTLRFAPRNLSFTTAKIFSNFSTRFTSIELSDNLNTLLKCQDCPITRSSSHIAGFVSLNKNRYLSAMELELKNDWQTCPFDGHNVLKRTKISTSEKQTILHGGTSDTFKTGTKIRCLKSHSNISIYLGECSHFQPLWSKLFVRIKTHWLSNKLNMELISSNEKTRWYTLWLDGTSDALLESQCGLKRFCVLFTMVSIRVKLR